MNYQAHYDRLIARAKGRQLDGYVEKHHVLPRCLGGGNEKSNIAELTAEEHFVAHQLLVKIHSGNIGIISAALWMAGCGNNKVYGWLRRRKSEAMRGNKIWVGRKHSAESKAKISAAHTGKKMSQECKDKMSEAGRRRVFSIEDRRKISAGQIGKFIPQIARQRASQTQIRKRDMMVTKVSKTDVMDIFTSKETLTSLAKKYGISLTYARAIRYGKKWKDVTQSVARNAT